MKGRAIIVVMFGVVLLVGRASGQAGTCAMCQDEQDACTFWSSGTIECIVRCNSTGCVCSHIGNCGYAGGGGGVREPAFAIAPTGRARVVVVAVFEISPSLELFSDEALTSLASSLAGAIDEVVGNSARARGLVRSLGLIAALGRGNTTIPLGDFLPESVSVRVEELAGDRALITLEPAGAEAGPAQRTSRVTAGQAVTALRVRSVARQFLVLLEWRTSPGSGLPGLTLSEYHKACVMAYKSLLSGGD